jgi:hypothetical protein
MATMNVMMNGPMYDLRSKTESFFTSGDYQAKILQPCFSRLFTNTQFWFNYFESGIERKLHLYADLIPNYLVLSPIDFGNLPIRMFFAIPFHLQPRAIESGYSVCENEMGQKKEACSFR